ncbi:aldo/keto reductase [Lacticaseibacillus mingshuiensis]|uniref:Aldo/keto reductase n=1 Tax=Lacticaseibacillus mingshuiensis TaxID=2799574 RepID=A0ABW4CJX6_9LACO|nr:aldo/keto reductase [Lacticaseibacillus mingshuiensis]
MKMITLAGQQVPQLGLGTWGLGENKATADTALAALQAGISAGATVIDTAEMYGDGAAETLVGRLWQTVPRDRVFLISKFYPWHADPTEMRVALLNSLRRLKTDYLDLYLLHWPGDTPLAATVQGLNALKKEGLIRAYGVSNFDVADVQKWLAVPDAPLTANEVLYNVAERGIEFDLLPRHRQRGITTIGYFPFNSGSGDSIPVPDSLKALAAEKGVTVHQLLLAWTMRTDVLSIPKASTVAHMTANLAAADLTLSPTDLARIDQLFPGPTRKMPLHEI